jgi:hypothetical protein
VQHDVDVLAVNHASGVIVGEMWVVFEAQGIVKRHGSFEVANWQVNEDLFSHVITPKLIDERNLWIPAFAGMTDTSG